MHIRNLHIKNFRAVRLQELRFEDAMGCVRPVTVLAGPNGCGKTSVLLAIYRALSGALGYYSDDVPDPSDNEVYREGGSAGWSFQPNRTVVALDLEYSQAELEAISHVFETTRSIQKARPAGGSLSPPSLDRGRMTVEWAYPPELRSDGTPNSTAYLRATPTGGATLLAGPKYAIRGWRKRPNPLVAREDLDEIGILRMFAQNRGKRWVAGEESDAFPVDGDPGSEVADTERNRRRSNTTVAGILKVLADAAAGRRLPGNGVEDLEERVRETFGRICAPKRYVGYVYFGATEPVGTPLMQEGERQ